MSSAGSEQSGGQACCTNLGAGAEQAAQAGGTRSSDCTFTSLGASGCSDGRYDVDWDGIAPSVHASSFVSF